jgi:monoamine oxidase
LTIEQHDSSSHQWSRRQLLRLGALGALGVGAQAFLPSISLARAAPPVLRGSATGQRVVVIGAGVAGLVAALELQRAGYQTTVLEARSRVGGRLFTVRRGDRSESVDGDIQICQFEGTDYFEAGGMRIHGSQDPTLFYCKQLEIPVETFSNTNTNSFIHFAGTDGALFRGDRVRIGRLIDNAIGYLSESAFVSGPTGPLANSNQSAARKAVASFGSLSDTGAYMGSTQSGYRVDPSAINAGTARAQIPADTVVEALNLLDRYAASSLDQVPTGPLLSALQQAVMLHPRDGMQAIPIAMAEALRAAGGQIIFNTVVTEMRQDAGGVTVVATSEGQERAFIADFGISTLLPHLLRKLRHADINKRTWTAINDTFLVENLQKTGIQARRFWEQDLEIFGGSSYETGYLGEINFPSSGFLSDTGVFMAQYYRAPKPTPFQNQAAAIRVEQVKRRIVNAYPEARPQDLGAGFSILWDKEKFTEGGFVFFRDYPNANVHQERLLAGDGRWFFAGDWTTYASGWAAGAIDSAWIATKNITALA